MFNLRRSVLPVSCLGLIVAAAGCGADASLDDGAGPAPVPSEHTGRAKSKIASVMGGIEAAIDAPWRLEPIGADLAEQVNLYPPIPITIAIHDASLQEDPATAQPLGKLCDVTILEQWNDGQTHYGPLDQTAEWHIVKTLPANSPDIREIERSDKWPATSDHARNHVLCRRWAGENCDNVLDVGSTAEWHATIAYQPQQYVGASVASGFRAFRQGDDVRLSVMARIARAGQACPALPTYPTRASFDRLSGVAGTYAITNSLSVHLGDGLPRFDGNWAYGDLHYHSQGTDNEGESAYAYRPTLQAMRALGLDFVFATDHASDSSQVTDIDEIYIDKRFDFDYVPSVLEDWAYDYVSKIALGAKSDVNAGRDMNRVRWQYMHNWINDPARGANAEVLKTIPGGAAYAPRLFLGGEVDVVPEISQAEHDSGSLVYGNNRVFRWASACNDVPDFLKTLQEWTTADICHSPYDLLDLTSDGTYGVKDVQGLGDKYFARQHMVYLPKDNTDNTAFVSGRTELYGGAHERLKDILDPAYYNTMVGKGYGFLAHPVVAPSGSDPGRLGPDVLPYSDVQLRVAFGSPAILGLQLWNEDSRLESGPKHVGFPFTQAAFDGSAGRDQWGLWRGKQPKDAYRDLHDGAFAWDKMLQWGLRPSQTAALPWVPAGEPRKVFMAGGSDAHGDWNYRREGSIDGASGVVDTAMGKPRNLVYVGAPRPDSVQDQGGAPVPTLSQAQVTDALKSGQFLVTDGPAVRIAIDRNGNGIIDDGDTMMGGTGTLPATGTMPVVVEWRSTPEFGVVSNLDLYVGVASSSTDASLVYAPANHGVRAQETAAGNADPHVYVDANGGSHTRLDDNYMLDPSGQLHITTNSSDYVAGPYVGRRVIRIDFSRFVVGSLRVQPGVQGPEVCKPNVWCRKPGFGDRCEIVCTHTTGPTTYHFDNATRPDRAYIRAFARTQTLSDAYCTGTSPAALQAQQRGQCIERLAFTNPVWAKAVSRVVVIGPVNPPVLAQP